MSTSINVLKSSSLLLLIKLIQRGMGVISTILLARLLVPADFGIVAISVTLIYFIEAISSLGSEQYIIQKSDVDDTVLNTAWTVDIIFKSIFLIGFLLLIPYIAIFYENPRLELVLYVSSTIILINALKNPGLFLLKRNFQYKRIFWLSIIQKFISFLVVIAIAIIDPSYWAMVVGDIVSALILSFGSYKIHAFRPKISLDGFLEQWLFSKWIILRGIVGYSRSQFDTFIVSMIYSPAKLGGYHLVRQLSIMPSTEIIAPAVEPLLAAFSRSKSDKLKLAYQFRLSFLIVTIIAMPIAGYLWIFPEPIIDTLLGEKWVSTYQYLSSFSVFFLSIALIQIPAALCVAIGKLKGLFVYEVLSMILIMIVLWNIREVNLISFILVRGGLGLITLTGLLIYLNVHVKINILYLLGIVSPVVLSVLISIYLSDYFYTGVNLPLLALAYSTVLFMSIYALILYLLFFVFLGKSEEWHQLNNLVSSQLVKIRKLLVKT